jgi:hypothetical protein
MELLTTVVRTDQTKTHELFRVIPEQLVRVKHNYFMNASAHIRRIRARPPYNAKSSNAFNDTVKSWVDNLGWKHHRDFFFVWDGWDCDIHFRNQDHAMLFKLTWM